MGYLRKALSISTLGLSNLVLDDESKPPVTRTRNSRGMLCPGRASASARPRLYVRPAASGRRRPPPICTTLTRAPTTGSGLVPSATRTCTGTYGRTPDPEPVPWLRCPCALRARACARPGLAVAIWTAPPTQRTVSSTSAPASLCARREPRIRRWRADMAPSSAGRRSRLKDGGRTAWTLAVLGRGRRPSLRSGGRPLWVSERLGIKP